MRGEYKPTRFFKNSVTSRVRPLWNGHEANFQQRWSDIPSSECCQPGVMNVYRRSPEQPDGGHDSEWYEQGDESIGS